MAALADEASARASLIGMQERLGRGPHAALGVAPGATADEIRGAFLALTKQFHPARFGRMDADLQRFANEVFLGLKSAHDLLKASAAPAVGRTTTSPGMPVLPTAAARPPTSPGQQPLPRPTTMGMPPIARSPGAPGSAGASGALRPAPRTDTTKPMPTLTEPVVRTPTQPGMPTVSAAGTPLARQAGTSGAIPRVAPTGASRPLPRPVAAAVPAEPGRMDPSTTKPPQPSVQVALELLASQQWEAAKIALSALAAQAPDSKHVRALAAFAVGRQAQVEKRYDEARIELQRALMLDPDLAPAKAALGELFARRK